MPYLQTNDQTSLYYRDWGTGAPVVFVNSAVLIIGKRARSNTSAWDRAGRRLRLFRPK